MASCKVFGGFMEQIIRRLFACVKYIFAQLWHLGCLSPVVESQKNEHSSEDGYGTGDQVLYSPKLSQACAGRKSILGGSLAIY